MKGSWVITLPADTSELLTPSHQYIPQEAYIPLGFDIFDENNYPRFKWRDQVVTVSVHGFKSAEGMQIALCTLPSEVQQDFSGLRYTPSGHYTVLSYSAEGEILKAEEVLREAPLMPLESPITLSGVINFQQF